MHDPWPTRLAGSSVRGLVLALAGAVLANREVVGPMAGFGVAAAGGAILALSLLALPVALARPRGRGAMVAAGLAAALAAAGAAAYALRHPRINDVSTDVEELPPQTAAVVRERYADLAPLQLPHPPEFVLNHALAVVKLYPDTTKVEIAGDRLQVECATRVFRFPDVYTLRVRPHGGGTRVDMRSRSRLGKGDFGVNAARIRAVLAEVARAVERR